MIAQERYEIINKMLLEKKTVQVSELIKRLDVSLETVRRDLAHLEKIGMLKRVYGGAVLEYIDGKQSDIKTREEKNWEQKLEIGEIISGYINENESIVMDSSTTNHAIARALKNRFKQLTVITNYLPIINELTDTDFTLVLTGGILQNKTQSFIGELSQLNLDKFCVDKAFMSMSGISLKDSLTDFGFAEIEIKRKLMSIASEVFVVADSSKFGVSSLMHVCDFDNIKAIFTDSKLDAKIKNEYKKRGVKIINKK